VTRFDVVDQPVATEAPDAQASGSVVTEPGRRPGRTSGVRVVPLVVAVTVIAVGLLFEFLWGPLVYHDSRWFCQSDMWGMFRAAHYVGWGDLGGIYSSSNGVVTFPGMPILLTPVAMLSGALHLSESFPPFVLPHPTAVLLLLPVELVLGSTVVFGADALAEELGVSFRRRAALCVVVAIVAWPVVAVWGHAEDLLTMTFAFYAMRSVLRGNWVRAGWLFGAAVVVQPLVALALPIFVATSPRGQRVLFTVRCAALSVFTVGVSFLGDPTDAFHQLVEQPTPPSFNHATPWVALAPRVDQLPTGVATSHLTTVLAHDRFVSHAMLRAVEATPEVQGGIGRTIYIVLALLVGIYVWRRPQSVVRLLWLAGVVLGARCFFESVMTPYYLAPPLLLLLVLAARAGWRRLAPASMISLAVTVFAYYHLSEWAWWLPVVTAMGAVMALAYPGSDHDAGSGDARHPEPTAASMPA